MGKQDARKREPINPNPESPPNDTAPLENMQQPSPATPTLDDEAGEATSPPASSPPPVPRPSVRTAPPPPQPARQGSQSRPHCPQCSTDDQPVLLRAASTPGLFTWYQCPNADCTYRTKVARPIVKKLFGRRRGDDEEFAAR